MGKKNKQKVVKSPEVGLKFDDDKLPMHLISPVFLERVAEVLKIGSEKYGDRNWEKGINFSRIYASTMRHLISFWDGENFDVESQKRHLAHAATCIMFLVHYAAYDEYNKFDDRPYIEGEENV